MPASDPWLRRVHGLLAKAKSTEFPDEAEALLAKAQELMSRHSIDEAMLAAAGDAERDPVVLEQVDVAAPYAGAKASLLANVAAANSCRCVTTGRAGGGAVRCVLVGGSQDIAATSMLFAALSLHAARAMLGAAVPPHDTPKRFRHSFLLAFASRVGARLDAAAAVARSAAQSDASAGSSVALVLADREEEVARAFDAAFPFIRRVTKRASSFAGAAHGRAAADRAPLGEPALADNVRQLPR
ncbi:MAG: DUF2786 domain-containing protein [Acidimicrobiales bacterium]